MKLVAAALLAAALVTTACGGGDDGPMRPLVAEIAPALAAVESDLGGPQRYFEVNATPQVVYVFVATDGGAGVTPFVYVGDELAPAGPPASAEGNTFPADAVSFDPATVLDASRRSCPIRTSWCSASSVGQAAPSSTAPGSGRSRTARST